MLHINILAFGFMVLMGFSIWTACTTVKYGRTEVIPMTAFGVGLFGLGVTMGGLMDTLRGLQSTLFVGLCWLSIVNSAISCFQMKLSYENLTGVVKND